LTTPQQQQQQQQQQLSFRLLQPRKQSVSHTSRHCWQAGIAFILHRCARTVRQCDSDDGVKVDTTLATRETVAAAATDVRHVVSRMKQRRVRDG